MTEPTAMYHTENKLLRCVCMTATNSIHNTAHSDAFAQCYKAIQLNDAPMQLLLSRCTHGRTQDMNHIWELNQYDHHPNQNQTGPSYDRFDIKDITDDSRLLLFVCIRRYTNSTWLWLLFPAHELFVPIHIYVFICTYNLFNIF